MISLINVFFCFQGEGGGGGGEEKKIYWGGKGGGKTKKGQPKLKKKFNF